MIRSATYDDLAAIRLLLQSANDSPYDLGIVAEEKCFGRGFSGEPRVRIAIREGRLSGVAVSCGRYLRLLAVSATARRKGIGSLLLRDAEREGIVKIAAEPGNYFTPGVWKEDRGSIEFLRRHGYGVTVETRDLAAETALPASSDDARSDRREDVLAFIAREFGAIWRFECERAAELLHLEQEGEIVGFAAIEANNRGLGTFGPTGVSAASRGRGVGGRLLKAALGALRARGFERAIIPWTDAADFYSKACGARIAHQFLIFAKP